MLQIGAESGSNTNSDSHRTYHLTEHPSQPFQNSMNSCSVPYVELVVESGVGNSDVPDPMIRMDYSLDGKTFKGDWSRRIGKIGDFKHRTIWRRKLGRVPRFVSIRFTLSDACKPVILQLVADVV